MHARPPRVHAEPEPPRADPGASLRRARVARALLAPFVVALPPLFWVVEATRRAALTPLGRDQGIFQYVAWALDHGAVDYRDIRDVNGPLGHLVHVVLLALGGQSEHRFRVLDLVLTGATFAIAGACLPAARTRRPVAWLERAAWALAGWVVLSSQYLLYGYWDTAQRESFFDWFLLPSLALQQLAQAAPVAGARPARRTAAMFAVAGALSVIPCFGKPTYALLTAAQIAALLLDRSLGRRRRLAAAAFVAGGAAGAATQLAFLASCGDALAFVHAQLVDVPMFYRFIWPRAPADMFSEPWRATQAMFAVTGAVAMVALIVLRAMPGRYLAIALAPVAALAGVVAQAKGFPYHFHPVTACVHLQWLAVVVWATERSRVAQHRLAPVRLVPVVIGTALALRTTAVMQDSPYIRATWMLWGAQTPEQRTTREYFAHFAEPDFFPWELRQAAAFVREQTPEDARVQVYGMDPYLLFLARRLSATPYIYAYDLNVDAALAGGTGGRPNAAQASRIRALRDANESDFLARLRAKPPAAFVFLDGAPLLTRASAWEDFEEHCPRSAAWVKEHYREVRRFGHDHVWFPRGRPIPPAELDEGDP